MLRCPAALSNGEGSIVFDEITVADPGPGEVRVEIHASGLCHTDWDFVNHRPPWHVMGHEGAGMVETVGSGVSTVADGDRVLLNWAIPCRDRETCRVCRRGLETLCPCKPQIRPEHVRRGTAPIARSFGLGTMARYALVPEAAVTRIPDSIDIPFTSACLLGCGVMTGVGSVLNTAALEPGSVVAVIGCGGVGLNCIQGARIAGASEIHAVDVVPRKLETAKRFGATHAHLATRDDKGLRAAAERVVEATGGGADAAFECTGIPALAFSPLAMIIHGGIAVEVSGVDATFEADGLLLKWDKTYIQSKYGQCCPNRDFPILLEAYATGQLFLDELVTKTYALQNLNDAIEDMLSGRNAKGVIQMAGASE